MADETVRINFKSSGTEKLKSDLNGLKISFTEINQATELVSKAAEKLKQVYDFAKEGAKIQQLERVFANLASGAGKSSATILAELRKVSQGTISDFELMSSATKAAILGIPFDKIPDLLAIATSASAAMGESATKLFGDIVTGSARQSQQIVDNLGISIKVSDAYAEATRRLGHELNAAEKAQAFLNSIAEKGGGIISAVGDVSDDAATKFAQFEAAASNLWDNLSQATTNVVLPFIEQLTPMLEGLNEVAKKIKELTEGYKTYSTTIATAIDSSSSLEEYTKSLGEELEKAEMQLKGLLASQAWNKSADNQRNIELLRDKVTGLTLELKNAKTGTDNYSLSLKNFNIQLKDMTKNVAIIQLAQLEIEKTLKQTDIESRMTIIGRLHKSYKDTLEIYKKNQVIAEAMFKDGLTIEQLLAKLLSGEANLKEKRVVKILELLNKELETYDLAISKEESEILVLEASTDAIDKKSEALRKFLDTGKQVQSTLEDVSRIYFFNDEDIQFMNTAKTNLEDIGSLEFRLNSLVDERSAIEDRLAELSETQIVNASTYGEYLEQLVAKSEEEHYLKERLKQLDQDDLNITRQKVSTFAGPFASALAQSIGHANNLESALKGALNQLIAMVAEAAILSAVMSAFGGGGFGGLFKSFLGFSQGGRVPSGPIYAAAGMRMPYRGTDTVPAMLTPGEYVIPRSIVEQNQQLLGEMMKNKTTGSGNTYNITFPKGTYFMNESDVRKMLNDVLIKKSRYA